jgi:hypothetical protein
MFEILIPILKFICVKGCSENPFTERSEVKDWNENPDGAASLRRRAQIK